MVKTLINQWKFCYLIIWQKSYCPASHIIFPPNISLRKKNWIFFKWVMPIFFLQWRLLYVLWGNIGRILSSMLNTMNKRRYKYLYRRPDCKYLIPSAGWKAVLQVTLNHLKSLLSKNTFFCNKKFAHKNAKKTNIGNYGG